MMFLKVIADSLPSLVPSANAAWIGRGLRRRPAAVRFPLGMRPPIRRAALSPAVSRRRCTTTVPHSVQLDKLTGCGIIDVRENAPRPLEASRLCALRRIQKRKAHIETHFNVQRRMADWHYSRAEIWAEFVASHEEFVANYNYQVHWAHRDRQDGRHSPAEVLGWVQGAQREPAELHRIFYASRFGRTLDKLGYVRFRHWRLYGELGLARKRAAIWLYKETLTVEFTDQPLAQYAVEYEPDW